MHTNIFTPNVTINYLLHLNVKLNKIYLYINLDLNSNTINTQTSFSEMLVAYIRFRQPPYARKVTYVSSVSTQVEQTEFCTSGDGVCRLTNTRPASAFKCNLMGHRQVRERKGAP